MKGILKFVSNFHKALWGGESWEISAHCAGPSVISGGSCDGRRLSDVAPGFPVLVKVIDAKSRLSVQVHPNETTCRVTGGEPKTEMWAMLADGVIYAGLKPGAGPADVAAAVKSGRFEELLVRHEAKKGEVFFIPGGLVHAIGDETLLYEVQQSSNTTFRLYDWNRVDANGRARELHVEKSLQAIDYSLAAPIPVREVACPYFVFRQFALDGARTFPARNCYTALFSADGDFEANGVAIPRRTSALVAPGEQLELRGKALVFMTEIPSARTEKLV